MKISKSFLQNLNNYQFKNMHILIKFIIKVLELDIKINYKDKKEEKMIKKCILNTIIYRKTIHLK